MGKPGKYRVTTFTKSTQITIHVHGETPDEFAKSIMEEGFFTEDQARKIVLQVIFQ